MKKIAFSFALIMLCVGAHAEHNPFTGNHEHQVALNMGWGVDSGIIVPPPARFVPFYLLHMQYSQPTTFFKLPARQSLNVAQTLGFGKKYGWHWDKYTIPMVMISGDVALVEFRDAYFSMGAGAGLQAQQNERLGAKLLFQLKLIAGYRLTDNMGVELFVQHFSNANTSEDNHSYAFYGAGLTYSF